MSPVIQERRKGGEMCGVREKRDVGETCQRRVGEKRSKDGGKEEGRGRGRWRLCRVVKGKRRTWI